MSILRVKHFPYEFAILSCTSISDMECLSSCLETKSLSFTCTQTTFHMKDLCTKAFETEAKYKSDYLHIQHITKQHSV